jgi:hypothetical protein
MLHPLLCSQAIDMIWRTIASSGVTDFQLSRNLFSRQSNQYNQVELAFGRFAIDG